MAFREITKEETIQTEKGTKIRFNDGDIIDKLVILECVGKRYVDTYQSYIPVYNCFCECGRTCLRGQEYLTARKKSRKQCNDCGRKNLIESARRNAEKLNARYKKNNNEESSVEQILNEIWFTGGPVYS